MCNLISGTTQILSIGKPICTRGKAVVQSPNIIPPNNDRSAYKTISSRHRSRSEPNPLLQDIGLLEIPSVKKQVSNNPYHDNAAITVRRTHTTTSLCWQLEHPDLVWNGPKRRCRLTTRQIFHGPFYIRVFSLPIEKSYHGTLKKSPYLSKSRTHGQYNHWELERWSIN